MDLGILPATDWPPNWLELVEEGGYVSLIIGGGGVILEVGELGGWYDWWWKGRLWRLGGGLFGGCHRRPVRDKATKATF